MKQFNKIESFLIHLVTTFSLFFFFFLLALFVKIDFEYTITDLLILLCTSVIILYRYSVRLKSPESYFVW